MQKEPLALVNGVDERVRREKRIVLSGREVQKGATVHI